MLCVFGASSRVRLITNEDAFNLRLRQPRPTTALALVFKNCLRLLSADFVLRIVICYFLLSLLRSGPIPYVPTPFRLLGPESPISRLNSQCVCLLMSLLFQKITWRQSAYDIDPRVGSHTVAQLLSQRLRMSALYQPFSRFPWRM